MHHHLRHALTAVLVPATLLFTLVPRAEAGQVKPEVWMTAGFVDPDYHDSPLAAGRAGGGIVAFTHVTAGASGQLDRDHYFYFGYVGVILPAIGVVEPYGRFHVGRRDDLDDTALGWTAGIRIGNGAASFLFEAYGVTEPGSCNGACVGISF
jgi:hypothetical protein